MSNINRSSQPKGVNADLPLTTKNSSGTNSNLNKRRVDAEKAAIKLRERNNLDRQQTALRRQKEFTEKTQLWNEILPKWNELSQSPKVKELCTKGIPPNIRGKVWPLLIGNELQVDEKLFEDLNRKVLLIYGNKVAANIRKISGDTADENDENGMHKDSTYKVFKDSFSSAEDADSFTPRSQRSFSDEDERQQQLDAAARAISADIPIPLLHQRLVTHNLRGSASVKIPVKKSQLPSHATHLDITEESWFQNERNGSLDSETFELIQKQLFKRSGNDGLGDSTGGNSSHYMDEEDDDISEHVEDTAVSSYAESESNSMRHAGIAAMCGTDSVESHFSLGSYSVIGSYCTPMVRNTDPPSHLASDTRSHLTTHLNPLTITMNNNVENDLDEMSFALATGGDTLSSRGIGSVPQSPGTPFDLDQLPILSLLPAESAEGSPVHVYCSESVMGSMGQYTPPPRRRHSEKYLIEVGLIVTGDEGDQTAHPDGISLGSFRTSPKSSPPKGTPLKTLVPFPTINSHQPGCRRPPIPPSAKLIVRRDSSDVARFESESLMAETIHVIKASPDKLTEDEGTEPKRRTSVSALTTQFQVIEDLALLAEQQKLADAQKLETAMNEVRLGSEGEEKRGLKNTKSSERKTTSENDMTSAADTKLLNTMCLIEWDLPRTFPTLGFFHDGGPMHTGLERILLCYACFRPEIGYVQGMSFLVATLLLYMDEFEAFKCLANLLGRRVNTDFYRLKKEAIDSYVRCFDHFFKKSLPLLYQHMSSEGVTSEMFLMDWNMALFTKALPLEVAAQVWDMYLLEGEMYIMCVGLGILKMFAPKLSTFGVEQISPFLLHLPERINPEELFMNVSQIQIPKKTYERVRKKMAEQARVEQEHQNGLRRNKSANNLQQHHTTLDGADHKQSNFPLGSSIKRALLDARDNLIGTGGHSTGNLTPPPQSSPPHSAHKKLTDHIDCASASSVGTDSVSETVTNSTTSTNGASKRRGSTNGAGQKKSGLECLQS